jgi:copper chaperone CopZ
MELFVLFWGLKAKINKMRTVDFQVENIKCGGCANSIKNGLMKMEGVEGISIDIEKGVVSATLQDFVDDDNVQRALHKMGYTAPGEGSGFDKAKSYVSCMIGRIQS